MNKLMLGGFLAAMIGGGGVLAADPEDMVLERGKFGEPDALATVYFEVGSARLTDTTRRALDDLVPQLAAEDSRIVVHGHASGIGDSGSNQRLSERRARTVRDYLVTQGIAGERLASEGFGETQPVDSDDTPEGRRNNRRVVLTRMP